MAVRTHPGPLVGSALTADPEPTHLASVDHTLCQGPVQSAMLAGASEEPPRPAPQDHCIIQARCFPAEGTKPALCALAFPEPGKAAALGCPPLHPSPLHYPVSSDPPTPCGEGRAHYTDRKPEAPGDE